MSARRVLVLGATGMLGRQLLAHRPLAGSKWSAVGLARRPAQEGDLALDLLACVNEETGAFVPPSDEIQKALEDVTDVVHCIGTLLDGSSAGYKRLLGKSLNEQPASTYERMNRDTVYAALALVYAYMPNVKTFSFVSATSHLLPFPFNQCLDSRYWSSKRAAETALRSPNVVLPQLFPGQTPVPDRHFERFIYRPGSFVVGVMYSDNVPLTLPVAATFTTMNWFKTKLLPSSVSSYLPTPPAPGIHVATISNRIWEHLQESKGENVTHVYEVDDILNQ